MADAKRAVTPAMLGLALGIAAVSFAFPIYRATKMYMPRSLYFLAGWPQWEFAASVAISLIAAFAAVLALCFAAGFMGVRARTTETALAAILIFETALVVTLRYSRGPFVGVPLAIVVAGVCASTARLREVARAVLWQLCPIVALGWFIALGYNVAAAALTSHSPRTPRFLETPPPARIVIVLLFDELDEELAFRLRPQRIAIPNFEIFDSQLCTPPASRRSPESQPSQFPLC